jgi:UDP-glucose:(heptosyl)LPS alpha-1,3-glucosyltransferase
LKIALVIERFEAGAGGVEGVAWTVAHGLAAAGEDVHVVARRLAPSERVAQHPVRVPTAWQPLRVLAFSRAAHARATALGVDVVHSFSRTRHQDVYRAGGGSHADYLRQNHGPAGRALRRLSPRHRVLLGMERRIFADPTQTILCVSPMVKAQIAARYRVPDERFAVIPNGVDVDRFHPGRRAAEGARLRVDLGVGNGPIWALVGSGLRRKGLDTALRALARGGPRNAELWVAGKDPTDRWRSLAASLGVGARVRFLGPRSDVESVYAAADALLLPTRYDAFANATLEAAASGLPVLTSGANGASELLKPGAIVVEDPEDVDGFAAGLDQLGDATRRHELGRAGRAIALGQSWLAHVAALRRLYRRVAG